MNGDTENSDQTLIDLSEIRDLRTRVRELEEAVRRLNGLGAELQSVKNKPGQGATGLAPKSSAVVSRRRAFGVGALVSLLAYFSRSSARAADALSIDANGNVLFNGRRNRFTDEENKGALRVGAAWSVPGIYSEEGPVVVGSENGNIWLRGKVGIGINKLSPGESLDVEGNVKAEAISATGTLSTNGGLSIAGGNADFGVRGGELINLYNHTHTIGVQSVTTYFRSVQNFAWYQGGSHEGGELVPGTNGKTLMSLNLNGLKIGDRYAAGGARQLRILSGSVHWNGDVNQGLADGYKFYRRDTGIYDIEFTTAFSSVPGASVTQVFAGGDKEFIEGDPGSGGHVLDNAVIVNVSTKRLRVKTGVSRNYEADRQFSFIVIGAV